MRMHLAVASLVLVSLATATRADDKAETPRALVERALKAMGGADKLEKYQAGRAKTKGTLELQGGIPFTQEVVTLLPDHFKEVLDLEVNGKKVNITTVFDGKAGWLNIRSGDKSDLKEAKDELLDELKEGAYMMRVGRLLLKDKNLELSPLGELKVDGKETVGVRIASKGHRDVSLYFDKKTGLPVKVEHRVHDFMANQDVTEDRIIKEYTEVEGIKVPKKVEVRRDGKKFMEVEVTEMKFLESVEKSEFAKPS